MAIPGIIGCFLCSGIDHWAEACWTQIPPTSKDHHEARLTMYRDWAFPDRRRVTPHQKQKLIENENDMWRKQCAAEEKRKSA